MHHVPPRILITRSRACSRCSSQAASARAGSPDRISSSRSACSGQDAAERLVLRGDLEPQQRAQDSGLLDEHAMEPAVAGQPGQVGVELEVERREALRSAARRPPAARPCGRAARPRSRGRGPASPRAPRARTAARRSRGCRATSTPRPTTPPRLVAHETLLAQLGERLPHRPAEIASCRAISASTSRSPGAKPPARIRSRSASAVESASVARGSKGIKGGGQSPPVDS